MQMQPSSEAVSAWARLIRVQQALLEAVEADLKRAGLPPLVWYDALLELSRPAQRGLRQRDLGASMLLAKHNLSRLIDRLEAEGLVMREKVADDGRGAFVRLTPAGAALRERMWPVYAQAIATHFTARLEEDDIVALGTILRRLAQPPHGVTP